VIARAWDRLCRWVIPDDLRIVFDWGDAGAFGRRP
jgi:hypothetical protein